VRAALVLTWEASDWICGKRLHPLLPLLMRHGHGGLDGQDRQQLLAMSAATIDRILTGVRASATGGSGGARAQRRLDGVFPFGHSPTGIIPRLALSKPI
jgi:hypothetical protein